MMATTELLLSIEEYAALPDLGQFTELVRGKVVEMNRPFPRHGQVCTELIRVLSNHVREHDLGHVVSNDAGIVTRRNPDTVRGPDVAFISYAKLPKGPLPNRYIDIAPEVIFEVLSPSDRAADVADKVQEYLGAGVQVVLVIDPQSMTGQISRAGQSVQSFEADDVLEIGGLLGSLKVTLRDLC